MSDQSVVWIIAGVVVLVALAIALVIMSRRRKEQRRRSAEQLRTEAAARTGEVTEAQRDATLRQDRAREARIEAERAEEKAREAEQRMLHSQAEQEDQLRRADQLDPRVDTRRDDYQPQVPQSRTSAAGTPTTHQTATGTEHGAHPGADPVVDPAHQSPTHRRA